MISKVAAGVCQLPASNEIPVLSRRKWHAHIKTCWSFSFFKTLTGFWPYSHFIFIFIIMLWLNCKFSNQKARFVPYDQSIQHSYLAVAFVATGCWCPACWACWPQCHQKMQKSMAISGLHSISVFSIIKLLTIKPKTLLKCLKSLGRLQKQWL